MLRRSSDSQLVEERLALLRRRSIRLAFLVVFAVSLVAAVSAAQANRESTVSSAERWSLVDEVDGVGRMDWSCREADARIRFTDVNRTARLAIRVGPSLYSKAWVQPRGRVDLPLGRQTQRWRVEPISEARPPVVVFRVEKLGDGCNRPRVVHHLAKPDHRGTAPKRH